MMYLIDSGSPPPLTDRRSEILNIHHPGRKSLRKSQDYPPAGANQPTGPDSSSLRALLRYVLLAFEYMGQIPIKPLYRED